MLDQEGEPGFNAFAGIAAPLPQKDVFRSLLADRRAAADASARGIAFHRIFNGFEVEAVMRAEGAVLRSDRRADHVAVDLVDRHPVARRAASGEDVADHGDGGGWIDEAIGEHPQDRDQEEGDDQLDDPADDRARPGARAPAFVVGNCRSGPLCHHCCLAAPQQLCQVLTLPQCSSAFTCGE